MSYIGNPPAERFTSFDYQDLTGGSGTSFTLTHPVGSAQEILVMVNNVVQEPGVAYTVSGTGLTMTGSIASTDDFYVVYRGKAIQTATHPSDRALTATDGTFTGDLTVDTNTLHVDATNNRVGVGTASPTEPFHIVGASGSATDMQIQGGDDTNSVRLFMGGDTNPLNGRIVYSTASDFMAFSTGGDQRVRVDSDGLKFGSDTAAANALNDYEEGTWTPAVANGTVTVGNNRYTKIGNIVNLRCQLSSFSDRSTSAAITISGLPYGSGSASSTSGTVLGRYNTAGDGPIVANIGNSASTMFLYGLSDGGNWVGINHSHLNNAAASFIINITYSVS